MEVAARCRPAGVWLEVLLTRRPPDTHLGGRWELPGGKLEPGDPVAEAVRREVSLIARLQTSASAAGG